MKAREEEEEKNNKTGRALKTNLMLQEVSSDMMKLKSSIGVCMMRMMMMMEVVRRGDGVGHANRQENGWKLNKLIHNFVLSPRRCLLASTGLCWGASSSVVHPPTATGI